MDAAGGGGWWRSRWAGDVAVAALVGVVMAADAWWNLPGTRQADAVTYLLLAVSVGAVLLRRRWPVPVAVVCGSALAGWYLLGHRGELLSLATMVALYTVAVQGDRRRTVLAGLAAVPGSAALGWVTTEPASAPVAEMLRAGVPDHVGQRLLHDPVHRSATVRAGFRALLELTDDLVVVGEAADGQEAVACARRTRPDVVLMDIRMPGVDGLEATRRIAADPALDRVRVLVLTTFDVDEYVFQAMRSGAGGFLLKDVEPDDLCAAVRVVAGGQSLWRRG